MRERGDEPTQEVSTFEMVETLINGRWKLKLPNYRAARPEWETGWEVERLSSMHLNLKPGMVIYDVGTEEGDLSALYALWGCDTVLIEPNPRVWPNIKAIWEANGLKSPLGTFAGFAAPDELLTSALMTGDPIWPASANGPMIGDHGFCNLWERPELPRIRLDTIAKKVAPPDAITMDVEGAELEVLKSVSNTLLEHRPFVWISVHPTFMADMYKQRVPDLWNFLRDHYYHWYLLDYDHELHVVAWPDGATVNVIRPDE